VPLDVSTGFLEGSQLSFCPYSPNVVEGKFSEGSSSLGTKDPKIRNLSDPLLYLMEI
jgi:hypothetical protein